MELHLTPQDANYLQTVLSRAVPRLRTTGPMAAMAESLKELSSRLSKGERDLTLDQKQAKYLRRTVRAAQRHLQDQSKKPGTGGMMAMQLQMLQPVFDQVLGRD